RGTLPRTVGGGVVHYDQSTAPADQDLRGHLRARGHAPNGGRAHHVPEAGVPAVEERLWPPVPPAPAAPPNPPCSTAATGFIEAILHRVKRQEVTSYMPPNPSRTAVTLDPTREYGEQELVD